MSRRGSGHTHDCENKAIGCTAVITCHCDGVHNYDGIPEWVCQMVYYGVPLRCEECATGPVCEECGYPEHLGHEASCEIGQEIGQAEKAAAAVGMPIT